MRAAFYESDITPPLGGFMWGHYREVRAQNVNEKLYAKAIVLENDGEIAAIISVDTCTIPEEMHDIVTKRIFDYTGIPQEKVCISSDHTHAGAPVSDGFEVGCTADQTYTDVFYRLVADTVILAYNRLCEVKVKYMSVDVPGIAFCRDYELNDGTLITHGAGKPNVKRPLALPDNSLSALVFEKDGEKIGAILNFACHLDTINKSYKEVGYCGDYPSILSKKLKSSYGHSFVSLFLTGAAGDINTANPNLDEKSYYIFDIGERLWKEFVTNESSAVEIEKDRINVIKEKVRLKRRKFEFQEDANQLMAKELISRKNPLRARNMMYYVTTNSKEYSDLYVQGILIGDVYISLLPGEIFTESGRKIKTLSPYKKTVVVENCNSYCGYIPTKECFSEKSNMYEISLCYHSCHVPESADMIVDKALEIANKI